MQLPYDMSILQREIKKRYSTLAELAREAGWNHTEYIQACSLLRGVRGPYTRTGQLTDAARRCVLALHMEPEILFGPSSKRIAIKKKSTEHHRSFWEQGWKIENVLLAKKIHQRYGSIRALVMNGGLRAGSGHDIALLIRAQMSPKRKNGEWRKIAINLGRVLFVSPKKLFPDEVYEHLYADLRLEQAVRASTLALLFSPRVQAATERRLIASYCSPGT